MQAGGQFVKCIRRTQCDRQVPGGAGAALRTTFFCEDCPRSGNVSCCVLPTRADGNAPNGFDSSCADSCES
eukprot:5183835-Prorocentrum_lima.AAC.1